RKTRDYAEHEARAKRGGGTSRPVEIDWGEVLGAEPTPDLLAQMSEECEGLLRRLNDEHLRQIAVWKMEGFTNEEIADKLGYVSRTVERKLRVIRELWQMPENDSP